MRSSLHNKLFFFDFLTILGLLSPIAFYFFSAAPRISDLNKMVDAFNVTLNVTSAVAKIDQKISFGLEQVEAYPTLSAVEDILSLRKLALSEIARIEVQAVEDHVLVHLIKKYSDSEKKRLTVQVRLAEELSSRNDGTTWSLKNQVRLLTEAHISKTSDLSEYLILSLKFLSAEINKQREFILTFGFLALALVCSIIIIKNIYLKERVVKPMQKIIRAQNEIKNDRLPGQIAINPKIDAEVFTMIDSFNRMEKSLVESKNFQTLVSAATAHDLKEPLSAIISLHHIWQLKKKANPDIRELELLWQRAILNCFSGLQLVDDILQFTRSSLGKIKIEAVALENVIDDARSDCFKWSDPDLDLDLHLDLNPQTQTTTKVLGDAKQLRMVFRNLIMNTIKHNDQSKPLFSKIIVRPSSNPDCMILKYIDQNSSEVMKPPETPVSPEGISSNSGLGLMICEKIIEKMGGQFKADKNDKDQFEVLIKLKTPSKKLS